MTGIISPKLKNTKLSEFYEFYEAKNPYNGGKGVTNTPVKRKLIESQNIRNLIGIFDTQRVQNLPGDNYVSESPAKRSRMDFTELNDHLD